MGVNHFILDRRTLDLTVGGVAARVGILRNIGKVHSNTADIIDVARRTWQGRQTPGLVLVPGHGAQYPGSAGLVLGWERGLVSTVDFDWSGLPELGIALRGDDGGLELRSQAAPEVPLTPAAAVAAGLLDADGRISRWRRPRITTAEVVPGWLERHDNPSSLGVVERQHHTLRVVLDNGATQDVMVAEPLSGRAVAAAGIELPGMTVEDAANWAQDNPERRRLQEAELVRCTGGDGLMVTAGQAVVHLVPDVPSGRIIVHGTLGGAGYPQMPEAAFHDAGDRLARYVGGTISCEGGGSLMLTSPAAPQFQVSLASDDDGRIFVVAMMPGQIQKLAVPAEAAGPFLADFALYLAELGGVALARTEGGAPGAGLHGFNDFLQERGIRYEMPGVLLRP